MLKAGFSRVDVTPPLGTNLAGYFSKRPARGIHDPIYLNAVAYGDGNNTNIIIAGDFLSIMEVYATKLRKLISETVNVPADNILICALHQHTSGRLGVPPWTGSIEDKSYLDVLFKKFCDVAKMAKDDMKDAVASTASAETAYKISFIRRYKMRDGSTVTNPPRQSPDIDRPIGRADNTVRLVRFKRAEGGDIALVNFSTHPDCIGGLYFSADWPGCVRRFVEKDLEGARCMVVNGAQGDVNHVDVSVPEGDPVMEQGFALSERMGRVIADTVVRIWNRTADRKEGRLFSEVDMTETPSNREGAEKKDYYAKIMDEYNSGLKKYSATVLGKARRVLNLDLTPIKIVIPVTVQGFSDVVFVGFGGEPFSDYAAKMREAAPESFVITCGLANGQEGYLPTADAFAEGGYEADSSRFTKSLPDDLQNAARRMLKKYDVK